MEIADENERIGSHSISTAARLSQCVDNEIEECQISFLVCTSSSYQMLVQVRTIIKFENGETNLDRYKSHTREIIKSQNIPLFDLIVIVCQMNSKQTKKFLWTESIRRDVSCPRFVARQT
ncbi:hypothetical protein LXL04_029954 [Taraxacum kok-saghyz]